MYHYLKWAAFSLFIKRNMRYLLLIVVSIAGIYLSDALYEDMARFLAMTGESGKIAKYLLMKWAAVLFFCAVIVWSIMRLGIAKESSSAKKSGKKIKADDPYLKRLEKFKTPKKLRSKSDLVIESRKKESGDESPEA